MNMIQTMLLNNIDVLLNTSIWDKRETNKVQEDLWPATRWDERKRKEEQGKKEKKMKGIYSKK